ncbi:hypothetical protein HY498_02370 [Candidatus Woesearchaeota archaeon]|nr:hypothetical protein [Candidatus Woesearchaeota archaeon]
MKIENLLLLILILALITISSCIQEKKISTTDTCTKDSDCKGECGGPGAPAGYEELVKKCLNSVCTCTSPTGKPFY